MASICLDLAFFSRAHTPTIILPPSGPPHRLPRHTARSPFQLLPTTSVAVFDWGIALCVSRSLFTVTGCSAGCCYVSLDTSRCRPWPISGSLLLHLDCTAGGAGTVVYNEAFLLHYDFKNNAVNLVCIRMIYVSQQNPVGISNSVGISTVKARVSLPQ